MTGWERRGSSSGIRGNWDGQQRKSGYRSDSGENPLHSPSWVKNNPGSFTEPRVETGLA
jgi:hypothetical protein